MTTTAETTEAEGQQQAEGQIVQRSPVVTVLGHVDHGKSSLLEAVKELKIIDREAGGITQHISAYEIEHEGRRITFIDTPGHEAFQQMRSRGARVADVALLVIDATEGIKPQTKEAIDHIKASGAAPIIVFNKMDKSTAEPGWIKGQLAKEGLQAEDQGGEIPVAEVSATQRTGIADLLELIGIVADMQELTADLSKPGEGVIVESHRDNKRGVLATIVLKDGTLGPGDPIATDTASCSVRALEDFRGDQIRERISPSTPALLLGFKEVPAVGEQFTVCEDMREAAAYTGGVADAPADAPAVDDEAGTAEDERPVVPLIVKADVAGCLEAVRAALDELPQDRVAVRVVATDLGTITENDAVRAKETGAAIVGFNVRVDSVARQIADRDNLPIFTFDVIYELTGKVKELMERKLPALEERADLGRVKILKVFGKKKGKQIVGGRVSEGKIPRGSQLEIRRKKEVIGRGKMADLQRNRQTIREGKKGDEVGILYDGTGDIEEGDTIVPYTVEKKRQSLE